MIQERPIYPLGRYPTPIESLLLHICNIPFKSSLCNV